MFIAYLTLLSALSISGVAIFYSVIGLATIFPGAFWPVIIMGSVLEVGKLVTASWLYRHWKQTRFLLRTYLLTAVVVLSFITSMGIFGFLSKAHLEQNLAEDTVTQRIEIINNKISSEETYINRQTLIISRAEKNLEVVVSNNDGAVNIEKENLKAVEDKFKTLLAVETNTINNLSSRLNILDKDVSDVLTANKSFFNEEKAAAELKASQKEERQAIETKINEAQDRIATLKEDYAMDTSVIQKRIEKLRDGDSDDKSDVYAQIEVAEANIVKAQDKIDSLVVEREPLQAKMIKLEAEVGPVKYIAALAVDWGVANEVDTSEAVRWVILIIICVFDPLAVLLLVAANQSLLRRFPVKPLPPEEVLDLEKPDDTQVDLKWNEMMQKKNSDAMDKATEQLKDWKAKLDVFNKKVPQPEDKPVEIIQKKTEQEEIDALKEKQVEDFKAREAEELQALEEYAAKAKREEIKDGFDPAEVEGFEEFNEKYTPKQEDLDEIIKQHEESQPEQSNIAEKIEEVMEPERTRPDFTEVLEPETAVQEMMEDPNKAVEDDLRIEKNKAMKGSLGQVVVKQKNNKVIETIEAKAPKIPSEKQTTEEKFHEVVEQRIDTLMERLDAGEITLEDLTPEDRQTIIDIRMQNESGENIK